MDPARITAVVLTKDEAANMESCLASLPQGVRILVLDAESTDQTRAIAERHGALVEVRPWQGFVAARRAALALVQTPWALFVDADERLDARLRDAILAASESAADGYEVLRTTEFCGRPMRGAGWGAEPLLRLLRCDRVRLQAHPAAGGAAELHERWITPGPVARLQGTLEHRSYPTLADYRRKFRRYTEIEAAGMGPSPARALGALALAAPRALWLYTGRGGWRDGWRGAYVCAMSALYPGVVQLKALRRGAGA
ncbi:MAG: glycosyltransferase family 2 protein [bacterium]|nr:glycosyltransferase family 2 protein [bacterium]